ncbi:hypothetical protein ANOBCDAF_00954 [Pleomorphomonas sp. T1.2MG-36]|uniref:DoxX family protein n=1 Tax=Pleomorphomonas sp. T1.2MG-36 TaxID=3041167 RepID=UPI00247744E0|nr:DoxX family protein [Pleomorphomonas sp. T1.2MG-36]CAI9402669.1 hypothetical protein ANOBCDAF_00954 [Pleomorphomonas sp. T1.2MG-36]
MSSLPESMPRQDARFSFATLVASADGVVGRMAQPDIVPAILRLALAVPFWRSGILKWEGFLQLNETAVYLFGQEFMLHLPGGPYPFPAPEAMAFLSGGGEVVLPVLLVLGLGTRFAALGLMLMTAVIQATVPDGWPIHLTWAAMALALMRHGPGRLSLDRAIARIARLSARRS